MIPARREPRLRKKKGSYYADFYDRHRGRTWISPGTKNQRDAQRRLIEEDAPSTPEISAWDLGQGETAVLAWAHHHPGYEAILDDQAAPNGAITLGLPVHGTLGMLLLAKKTGLIERVEQALQEIMAAWTLRA
ncbi:hypothetical protein AWN76_008030 [Rhodothermaceae bacterium RA]|nr:hypothetical protein AWN76_008030 [Rhodothermaceae bacterium RA]